MLGVFAERVADLFHRKVHALLEVDEGVARPERRANLLTGHQLP
jgi:hypothetical protein